MDNQNLKFIRTFMHRTVKMADHTADVTGETVNLFAPIAHQFSIWVETGTVTTLTDANYYTVVVEESLNGSDWITTNSENLNYDVDWADDNEGILNDVNVEADKFRSIGYARDIAETKYLRVNLIKTGAPQVEVAITIVKHGLHKTRDRGQVILKGNEV